MSPCGCVIAQRALEHAVAGECAACGAAAPIADAVVLCPLGDDEATRQRRAELLKRADKKAAKKREREQAGESKKSKKSKKDKTAPLLAAAIAAPEIAGATSAYNAVFSKPKTSFDPDALMMGTDRD